MKVVIVGGSGFIGTRLVELLIASGMHDILIFDKNDSDSFHELVIKGDVRNVDDLTPAFEGVGVIINLAAEHKDNVSPKSLYYDVNVEGAENICKAATHVGVKKILFTSTVALYGLNKYDSKEVDVPDPFNDYGESKYQAEQVFIKWAEEDQDNSLVIVRPVVIFGENNRGNVFNLLKQISSGSFVMIGKGKNKKSMGYVGNIAAFLKHCIDNDFDEKVATYNYADKPDMNMDRLVGMVNKTLSINSLVQFRIPYWFGMAAASLVDVLAKVTGKEFPISAVRVKKFCADTIVNAEKLETTGFVRPYTIEDGLKRTLEHEFLKKGTRS